MFTRYTIVLVKYTHTPHNKLLNTADRSSGVVCLIQLPAF